MSNMRMTTKINVAREVARRRGFSEGLRSVFRLGQPVPPPPPRVRRATGTLDDDARSLRSDADRLLSAQH